ncbi:hypothetical protein BC826DRAFT_253224 [Russula brevipes]|nr:hypothetical protein BC826DRAFT_253224 [Russula brevipes]
MFAHPQSNNTSTPQQSRPSRSARYSSGLGPTQSRRTASLGRARVSPYARPPPKRSPMYMANKAATRNRTLSSSSTASFPTPMSPPRTRPVYCTPYSPARMHPTTTPLFPTSQQFRELSASRATYPTFDPPRGAQRPRDRALPTVQLLRVLDKCWSDDPEKLQNRAVASSGHERCGELDRSARWNPLGHTIHNVWPDLKGWIMNYIPPDDDTHWFTGADRVGNDEYTCTEDPEIATKHSSEERVGFFSTFSSSPLNASSK